MLSPSTQSKEFSKFPKYCQMIDALPAANAEDLPLQPQKLSLGELRKSWHPPLAKARGFLFQERQLPLQVELPSPQAQGLCPSPISVCSGKRFSPCPRWTHNYGTCEFSVTGIYRLSLRILTISALCYFDLQAQPRHQYLPLYSGYTAPAYPKKRLLLTWQDHVSVPCFWYSDLQKL